MMSNSSKSTHPTGRVLWEELLKKDILHISPLCFTAYVLKDKDMGLQDE